MTIQHLYPTTRPSLDLNFARTKRLDPRVTFTRGSTATYVGSDGLIKTAASNEARFDHDPTTGESLGLLVEEARTNSQTYSNNFATNWTLNQNGTAYVIPNAAQSPSGQYDASKLINNTGAYIQGPLFITGNNIGFGMSARFDLSTKTVTTQGSVASTSITEMGNGWFRCAFMPNTNIKYAQVVFAKAAESSVLTIEHWVDAIRLSTTGGLTGGILIWGAQVEAGTFPTSYIPTPATFTSRASTATYYDANGTIQTAGSNVARSNAYFPDENGVMKPAGLLLEAARTNLVTYSEDLTDASWLKGSSTVTGDAIAAPDGTITADKLVENTQTSPHIVSKNATTTAATHTFSVYLKKAERSFAMLYDLTNAVGAYFNLDTGVISTGGSGVPAAPAYSSQNVGNGWWRCSITTTATSGTNTYRVYLASSSTVYSYTGDGTSGIYIWGAQLETGSYPTSYIPTSGSTVTRAADVSSSSTVTRSADVASMTGTNFSSWYNQSEGTAFVSGRTKKNTHPHTGWASFFQTSAFANNRISIRVNNSLASSNGSVVANFTQGFPGFDSPATIVFAYKANDFALDASYQTLQTDTSGSVPNSIDKLQIGEIETGGATLNGPISRLTYYPTRLTDAQLQALTL